MISLLAAVRDLLHATRAAHLHLCVRANEYALRQAQQHLADALDARDRLRADERIAGHVEQQDIPHQLFRK